MENKEFKKPNMLHRKLRISDYREVIRGFRLIDKMSVKEIADLLGFTELQVEMILGEKYGK